MENASKALIIAGAILLSILIIGLGMTIYNKAADAMSGAGLDSQKAMAYNSEFENYEGLQSGQSARKLCDLIKAHNNSHQDDETLNITVTVGSATPSTTTPSQVVTASEVSAQKALIKSGKQYKVTFGYDTKTGYIVDCVIEPQ